MMARVRRGALPVVVVAACVAGVLVGGASASSASSQQRFVIAGGGAPRLPGHFGEASVVRTANGSEDVAALVATRGGTDNRRVEILSHRKGARHWTHSRVPAGAGLAGVVTQKRGSIDAHLSSDGKRIDIVVDSCVTGQLDTTSAPVAHLDRAKPLRPAVSGQDFSCLDIDGGTSTYRGFVSLPSGEITILYQGDNDSTASVVTGMPGQRFGAATSLESSASSGETAGTAITRDPKTGEIVVVGGAGESLVAWSHPRGGTWSAPAALDEPAALNNVYPFSVTAFEGRVTVAMEGSSSYEQRDSTIGVVRRNRSGSWSRFSAIPHAGVHSFDPAVLANPSTGHVHAVWGRFPDDTSHDRIMHSTYIHGHWKRPKALVKRIRLDRINSFMVTASGHPVVGYVKSTGSRSH